MPHLDQRRRPKFLQSLIILQLKTHEFRKFAMISKGAIAPIAPLHWIRLWLYRHTNEITEKSIIWTAIRCILLKIDILLIRPCGLMDKASDFESEDCRFESCHGRIYYFLLVTDYKKSRICVFKNNPYNTQSFVRYLSNEANRINY